MPEGGEDGLDKGEALARVQQGPQSLDPLKAPHRVRYHRTLALDHVKLDSKGGKGGEDVGEEDDAVRLEGPPRLEAKLDCNIGGF